MPKLKVKITSKHILDGKPVVPNRCAFALALREVFPKATVGLDGIALDSRWAETTVPLKHDDPIRKFIELFDMYENPMKRITVVAPCELVLDIPDLVFDQVDIPQVNRLIEESQNMEICKEKKTH